jgi:hypothetical protein
MALRNVTSSDERKQCAVAALKAASGARAVTMVKHDTVRNTFIGHCLNKGANAESFGFHAVDAATLRPVGRWESLAEYKASEARKS